eukprot:Gb_29648 [translate_table: standard]
MSEAFPSIKARNGHKGGEKMVRRSTSARVQCFVSFNVNPQFARQTSAYSSSSSADQTAPMRSHLRWIEESSRDQTRHSNPNGSRAANWSRRKQTEMAAENARTKEAKGSKWKQIVKKFKGYVQKATHHSNPPQRLQYDYGSHAKNFNGHIKRSINNPSAATVWPVRRVEAASAANVAADRIPIWQRRNLTPIAPLKIPKVRPSRSRNTSVMM